MALSNQDLLKELSAKPIMEVVELVKMLEEEWGVSAAAPVAVAAAAVALDRLRADAPSAQVRQRLLGDAREHRLAGDDQQPQKAVDEMGRLVAALVAPHELERSLHVRAVGVDGAAHASPPACRESRRPAAARA